MFWSYSLSSFSIDIISILVLVRLFLLLVLLNHKYMNILSEHTYYTIIIIIIERRKE